MRSGVHRPAAAPPICARNALAGRNIPTLVHRHTRGCTGTLPPLWAPKIMPLRPAPVEHKFLSGGPWGMLRPNCAGGSRSTQRQPGWTCTGCSEHHVPRTIAFTRALHKSTAGLSPCALWGRGGPDSARSILTPTAWPFSAPCACNSGPGSALWTPAQDWAGIGPLPPCAYAYAPCASSAQALRKLCVSLAQALRKPCAALHKPCTSFLPPQPGRTPAPRPGSPGVKMNLAQAPEFHNPSLAQAHKPALASRFETKNRSGARKNEQENSPQAKRSDPLLYSLGPPLPGGGKREKFTDKNSCSNQGMGFRPSLRKEEPPPGEENNLRKLPLHAVAATKREKRKRENSASPFQDHPSFFHMTGTSILDPGRINATPAPSLGHKTVQGRTNGRTPHRVRKPPPG